MDRACAAQPRAASELRSRQVQDVAQRPEQRHLLRDVDTAKFAVDVERDHSLAPDSRKQFRGRRVAGPVQDDAARSMSITAWANACGASWGRLWPMPPATLRCVYLPENFFAYAPGSGCGAPF